MTEYSLIADPAMARGLLDGTKTQHRLIAGSLLRGCAPGDRVSVRESCIPGRIEEGGTGELATSLRKAEFMVFPDGWRQHRGGWGHVGTPPGDPDLPWTSAVHMPRWAMRMALIVEDVRVEPLQRIGRGDIRAEGARPVCGGLLWRWPKPVSGLWRNSRRAFAAYWDVNHATPGERWEDDPLVIVLSFRVDIFARR